MKELMLAHGEKIALGVSLLILLVAAALSFLVGGAQEVVRKVEEQTCLLDLAAHDGVSKPVLPESRRKKASLQRELARFEEAVEKRTGQIVTPDFFGQVQVMFKPAEKGKEPEAESFQLATVAIPRVTRTPITVRDWYVYPPNLVKVAADYGQVKVVFQQDFRNAFARLRDVIIERRKPDGEFRQIGSVAATETTFIDDASKSGLEPRARYEYRVRLTYDPPAREPNVRWVAHREGDTSTTRSVTTRDVVDIQLKGIQKVGQEVVARIHVRKFVEGEWKEEDYNLKVGDMIGTGELETGVKLTRIEQRVERRGRRRKTERSYDLKTKEWTVSFSYVEELRKFDRIFVDDPKSGPGVLWQENLEVAWEPLEVVLVLVNVDRLGAKTTAELKVEKMILGEWEAHQFTVSEGDRIGAAVSEGEETLDFTTEYLVKRIEARTRRTIERLDVIGGEETWRKDIKLTSRITVEKEGEEEKIWKSEPEWGVKGQDWREPEGD